MRRVLLASASVSAFAIAAGAFAQTSTTTYSYDALGRLAAVQTAGGTNNGKASSLCYDAAGNRTQYVSSTNGTLASCTTPTPSPSPSPSPTPAPSPTPTPTPTPAPLFAIGDSQGTEGDVLMFAVTKTGSASSSYSVNYATAYGTAGSGDFTATSGTLTFAPGDTVKYISVSTKTDIKSEPNETFYVNLSLPSGGATITDSQGLGTIYDDGGGGGCRLC